MKRLNGNITQLNDPTSQREAELIESLQRDTIGHRLNQTMAAIEKFHPPAVLDALFTGTLERPGEVAVNFAAMLFYLHGITATVFDWRHLYFFLLFDTADSVQRKLAFREMCAIFGVDCAKYLDSHFR